VTAGLPITVGRPGPLATIPGCGGPGIWLPLVMGGEPSDIWRWVFRSVWWGQGKIYHFKDKRDSILEKVHIYSLDIMNLAMRQTVQ